MRVVISGPKGAGKSAVGQALASLTGLELVETDAVIADLYNCGDGTRLTCREIFNELGEEVFRSMEAQVVELLVEKDWCLVATGGSIMLDSDARRRLRDNALIILLTAPTDVLWDRATKDGIPPWLEGPDGRERLEADAVLREEAIRPFANIVLGTAEGIPEELAERLAELIGQEFAVYGQNPNTFGHVIRVTTFGESHGPAIGAVLDGIQPGTPIAKEDIQRQLDRRRPGQSKVVTRRKEPDEIHILSGVFDGKATGAPIAMLIHNQDPKSATYDKIRDLFRPGHADFTFYRKYGLRDHRGGGRSSGRETACRVACGAVAQRVLDERGVRCVAHAVEIAGVATKMCDYDVIETNPVRCADAEAAQAMEAAIQVARKDCDSVGGIVQLDVLGVPVGLGDPVFGKLEARLAGAIMSIGAVKGVEIGKGFALARMRGSESNDNMADGNFLGNNAGGITGGISTGQTINLRIAVKPTSSIAKPQRTLDTQGRNSEINVHGRHDPCIVPRAIPVIESMAALVILDAWEMQSRLRPGWDKD